MPAPVTVALAGLLGLLVGSFLNVVIHRLPRGESLSRPGSHCPVCQAPVRIRHNVPVLGWLVLRGRCADCRTPISVRYPLVEVLTGLGFAFLVVLAYVVEWAALVGGVGVLAVGGTTWAMLVGHTTRAGVTIAPSPEAPGR